MIACVLDDAGDEAFLQRKPVAVSAFVATLGYPRASYVEFVGDERMDSPMTRR